MDTCWIIPISGIIGNLLILCTCLVAEAETALYKGIRVVCCLSSRTKNNKKLSETLLFCLLKLGASDRREGTLQTSASMEKALASVDVGLDGSNLGAKELFRT